MEIYRGENMKNMEKKKVIIGFSFVLVLILIFLFIGQLDKSSFFSSSIKRLENDKLELEKKVNVLNDENDNLYYENGNLIKHLENLEEQIQQLGGQTGIEKNAPLLKLFNT